MIDTAISLSTRGHFRILKSGHFNFLLTTHRNLEAIWLLRRLTPDFKTIADFRRDNRKAFRQVFREFVRLCRELDLYGRELVAVDGTRIKAVNHRDCNFTQAKLKRNLQRIDDLLNRYLDQMNEADANEGGGETHSVAGLQAKIVSIRKRKESLVGHRQTLVETGEAQLSLTDPDSRSMHAGTRVKWGTNHVFSGSALNGLGGGQNNGRIIKYCASGIIF